MPPKKEVKEKQVKGDEAEEMVLSYMMDVNRPYASADVIANLKNKVPKTLAVKILATLAEKGQLTVKTYGKQLLYLYNQSLLSVLDKEELTKLDEKIKLTQTDLDERRKVLRSLHADLTVKEALPKTEELGTEIERIKIENDITTKALETFRGASEGRSNVAPMSPEEIKRIDIEFHKWRKEWVARRKVYKDFVGQLAECGLVCNLSTFEEDLGITPDDEEAQGVEKGEFCRAPVLVTRAGRPRHVTKPVDDVGQQQTGASTKNKALKRTGSVAGSQEDASRKKAKKEKAV